MFSFFGRKPPPPNGFADPSLRLAVLDAAWKAKLLPEFDKDAFYRDVQKKGWDAQRDGYEVDQDVVAALLAIELPPRVQLRTLCGDVRGRREWG